ncbi:Probable RNA-directed DNA polymerase from transposon BS [Eumeta japonica]|uniref:Probable RNA-directed DNA polymerase from transposon BS n=1 Tax=Eumeta variegata TaxID=151549 RepID=A0A4C1Y578_EUMVA|nr:Probable RNA-directed DNA polymerase from transposon BS [Eumeta japonica]
MSGRWSRRGGVPASSSPEVSTRYSRIDKSENAALPRERISHSRVQIQSASSPTRSESSRSELKRELERPHEGNKPFHKAFWAVTKAQNRGCPTPTQKPDNSVAIDDAEIAECLADSIETQMLSPSPPHDIVNISRIEGGVNRHFTFRHERTHSTRRLIRAGVPQSSTLSPLLYSAYTNDTPRPPSSGVQLALFADDTALFYGSKNRSTRFTLLPLQRAIDELGQWFRKWRIEVNPDKSAAIQFKCGKIRSRLIVDKNTPNLKMLDANIPWQRN